MSCNLPASDPRIDPRHVVVMQCPVPETAQCSDVGKTISFPIQEEAPEEDFVKKVNIALDKLQEKEPLFMYAGKKSGRQGHHAIAQYPAMMVPAMQGAIIDAIKDCTNITRILDPFMGAGTILLEARRRNLDFTGVDINPYALLISNVKSFTYNEVEIRALLHQLKLAFDEPVAIIEDVKFSGREKWFAPEVLDALLRIRHAIACIPIVQMRRLLWVAFGETVRVTSNSRTSTFKLHMRDSTELKARVVDVWDKFNDMVEKIIGCVNTENNTSITDATDSCKSHILHGDILKIEIDSSIQAWNCDLLVTSPPYGDNVTTVPYGQFSYLPSQLIPPRDFPFTDERALLSVFRSTHALDTASLGGTRRDAKASVPYVSSKSPSFRRLVDLLESKDANDAITKVSAFARDVLAMIPKVLQMMRPGSMMVWTVGNRRTAGQLMPFDSILKELFEDAGCKHVRTMQRKIPSKRMAVKNSVSDTMRLEYVVVLMTPSTQRKDFHFTEEGPSYE